MPNDESSGKFPWIRAAASALICLVLLGSAGAVSYLIFASEPEPQREGATRRSAALVETIPAERGTYRPLLEALGRVEAASDIELSPLVTGQIVAIEPNFIPGGLVRKGETLVRLDTADFEPAVTMIRSELHRVEAELEIEQGRQEAARREFELLGEDIDPANRSLVLREPQIASIRAQLEAARAALERSQLDLDRTTIRAPFDALVLTREANIGSQMSTGDTLGRLVGSDEYWVMATVPLRSLRWIEFAGVQATSSSAQIRQPTAWAPGESRLGVVERLIGALDEQTRLARVLITVPDPLALETDGPSLILGSIVQVRIEGRPIEGVIRINRDYVRQGDTVWVMEGGALSIRDATVVFRDAQHAYISSGIETGEQIVTTSLATVIEGLELRLKSETNTQSVAEKGGDP